MNCDAALAQRGNIKFNSEDVFEVLKRMDICKGDTVCIHSDLIPLGLPAINKKEYMECLIHIFEKQVGNEGTIIMPTFTYSFCHHELYNIKESPSKVGSLTEHFRTMPDVVRTKHPIFSFAVWGRYKDEYCDIGPDAFGADSVYGKLIQNKGKLLQFGSNKGYTIYYLAAEHLSVSNRFFKVFDGFVKDEDNIYHTTIPYYVRSLEANIDLSNEKVSNYLESKGVQKTYRLGGGHVAVAYADKVYFEILDQLRSEEDFFLVPGD